MANASITSSPFGSVDGQTVQLFTLTNARGSTARITNYGGIVTQLLVPDRQGRLADVVLGYDALEPYQRDTAYLGAMVGRVGNRIAQARFTLDGQSYTLAANDGVNHLHGGRRGWNKVVWQAEPQQTAQGPALRLTYVSPDGEEGYPGTVTAIVSYTLTNDDDLRVEMTASTDRATPLNIVHHTYWNLAGAGTILDHELTLHADSFTPVDAGLVPDGTLRPVAGTPFDFRSAKRIGRDLAATGGTPVGYDHNFVVNGPAGTLRPVARLVDPPSGRSMTVLADQAGVQFYSGNFLDGSTSGKGRVHEHHAGLCLETQAFPNSINVNAWRDAVVLRPGQSYRHTMVHQLRPV